jgi:hypothetical protein
MLLIARDQIVRARSVGTFKEHIVVGVACDIQAAARNDGIAVVFDELQQLLPETLADSQFRAAKDFSVFLQDGSGHIQAGRSGNGEQQDSALQPCWLNSGGNQDICIDYKTERKHYGFGFRDREVLMIWSI